MVADVLAYGKPAVSLQARKNLYLVKLGDKHICLLVEFGCILRCPPVHLVSVLVEKTSLVIETVRHFMSDNHADRTIVHSVVSIRIEERRLKYGSRETDFIGSRIIVCIDGLRSHSPL